MKRAAALMNSGALAPALRWHTLVPRLPLALCIQHGAVTPRGKEGRERCAQGGRGVFCESARPKHATGLTHHLPLYVCDVVQAHTNIPPMRELYLGHRVTSYSADKWGRYFEQHGGIPYVTSHPVPDKHTTHDTNKHWTKGRVCRASSQHATILHPHLHVSSHSYTQNSNCLFVSSSPRPPTPPPLCIYICSKFGFHNPIFSWLNHLHKVKPAMFTYRLSLAKIYGATWAEMKC